MVFFSIYKNKPNSVPWCEPKDGHVSWYIIADILFASELFQFQQVLKRAALAPGRVYHAILLPVCECTSVHSMHMRMEYTHVHTFHLFFTAMQ